MDRRSDAVICPTREEAPCLATAEHPDRSKSTRVIEFSTRAPRVIDTAIETIRHGEAVPKLWALGGSSNRPRTAVTSADGEEVSDEPRVPEYCCEPLRIDLKHYIEFIGTAIHPIAMGPVARRVSPANLHQVSATAARVLHFDGSSDRGSGFLDLVDEKLSRPTRPWQHDCARFT